MESSAHGKVVTLRPASLDDRRAVYEWTNLSDIAHWINLPPNKSETYEQFCADWEQYYFDGSAPRMGRAFVIEVHARSVGMIAYNDIDAEDRVEVDIWLSCEAECGKGYGSDAITTMCTYLRDQLAVREIWCQPSARNPRSIRTFEKCGFVRHDVTTDPYAPRDYGDSVTLVFR